MLETPTSVHLREHITGTSSTTPNSPQRDRDIAAQAEPTTETPVGHRTSNHSNGNHASASSSHSPAHSAPRLTLSLRTASFHSFAPKMLDLTLPSRTLQPRPSASEALGFTRARSLCLCSPTVPASLRSSLPPRTRSQPAGAAAAPWAAGRSPGRARRRGRGACGCAGCAAWRTRWRTAGTWCGRRAAACGWPATCCSRSSCRTRCRGPGRGRRLPAHGGGTQGGSQRTARDQRPADTDSERSADTDSERSAGCQASVDSQRSADGQRPAASGHGQREVSGLPAARDWQTVSRS